MRRYGRTLVSEHTARSASYDANIVGADHADYSGNCASPVMVCLTGAPDARLSALRGFRDSEADYGLINGKPYWKAKLPAERKFRHIDIAVRCRKCEPCRKARRNQWIARAKTELSLAPRTWFGTLTLAPEQQFRLIALASSALRRGGTDYNDLSEEEQFKERCKPLVREVQLYFKRLRKAGCQFRYLVAIERHKSGAPHVHFLMHEVGSPSRHKTLTAAWRLGFSKIKLVAEHENSMVAYYVAKYLTKQASRLLASSRYGKHREEDKPPQPDERRSRRVGAF